MDPKREAVIDLIESIGALIFSDTRSELTQDLHVHTTFSDGFSDPIEVVTSASRSGLDLLAITDHNNIDAFSLIAEKLGTHLQCPVLIPGVELSTGWNGIRVHILAYFLDTAPPATSRILSRIRRGHWEREKLRIRRLRKELKLSITHQHLLRIVGNKTPNWKYVAEALVAAGDAETIEEASEQYLKKGRPGYISYKDDWPMVTPEIVVKAITDDYGIPAIAHPGDIESILGTEDCVNFIYTLKEHGLAGFDTSCPRDHHEMSRELRRALENKMGLYPVIGTDNHQGVWSEDQKLQADLMMPALLVQRALAKHASLLKGYALSTCIQPLQLPNWNFFMLPRGIVSEMHHDQITTLDQLLNKVLSIPLDESFEKGLLQFGLVALAERLINAEIEQELASYIVHLYSHYNNRTEEAHRELRRTLENRIRRLEEIKQTKQYDSRELIWNLRYWYPIAYRLCFYEEGACIRNESLELLMPEHFQAFHNFYEYTTNACSNEENWNSLAQDTVRRLSAQLQSSELPLHVSKIIIRTKKDVASAYKKLVECWLNGYDPKNKKKSRKAALFLRMFEQWPHANQQCFDSGSSITDLAQAIFEDLMAFTFIIDTQQGGDLHSELINIDFDYCMERLESISRTLRRWYHKRTLVWGIRCGIPVEILFKGNDEYWLGLFYYWLTKNIPVFGVKVHLEEARLDEDILANVKACRSETELQCIALESFFRERIEEASVLNE